MEKLKVLIIDESVIIRNTMSKAIENTGLGTADRSVPNKALALEWLEQRKFDLILMDSGIAASSNNEFLKNIKNKYPDTDIIIMGNEDAVSIADTLEALKHGALDFIVKNESEQTNEKDRLKNQLHVLFAQIMVKKYSETKGSSISKNFKDTGSGSSSMQHNRIAASHRHWDNTDLIVIASSTGGPAALETIFRQMPAGFSIPILVVQHMPAEFTRILAQTLDKKYPLPVAEGKDGDTIKDGHAVIAPGGMHMKVSSGMIRLENSDFVNGVRPAADVLFNSVAKAYKGKNILAVILTGMGNDGMAGISEIKKSCNLYCITQSESTCVVYGMPRSVYEAGLSDEVADIKDIAGRICQIAQSGGKRHSDFRIIL